MVRGPTNIVERHDLLAGVELKTLVTGIRSADYRFAVFGLIVGIVPRRRKQPKQYETKKT